MPVCPQSGGGVGVGLGGGGLPPPPVDAALADAAPGAGGEPPGGEPLPGPLGGVGADVAALVGWRVAVAGVGSSEGRGVLTLEAVGVPAPDPEGALVAAGPTVGVLV